MERIDSKTGLLMAKLALAIFILLQCEVSSVYSVIMPYRIHSSNADLSSLLLKQSNSSSNYEDENPIYLLTINEGDSVDLKTKSKSNITINLNRAIPEDVDIKVKIFSGPNLIRFDTNQLNKTNASIMSDPTQLVISFKANTFGDKVVLFHSQDAAGHAEIVCVIQKQPKNITVDYSTAYISINVFKSWTLTVLTTIIGWIYFFAWSLSFYFQVILNYRRKSVVGLNFDFLTLNLLGFTCYSIYNFTFLFSREVQRGYYESNTYGRIPVEYNDLFFSVHAFVLTLITVIQCFIYERGEQKISLPSWIIVGLVSVAGVCLYITSLFNQVKILDVVCYLSYVKLVLTIIKYTPQAYFNYQRKATTGWSIHNILLDFTGGVFSLAQMFLLSYNYDDWISIFGNFTKFGLGLISILFDIVFVIQHYILYKEAEVTTTYEDSIPSPVMSETLRSSSLRAPQQPSQSDDENVDV